MENMVSVLMSQWSRSLSMEFLFLEVLVRTPSGVCNDDTMRNSVFICDGLKHLLDLTKHFLFLPNN